jgi:hypothetical protein
VWGAALAFLLTLSCHPADAPGVPLYPNAATTRLPRSEVAQIDGPIAVIDGREVVDQGGRFDLLPGCHVIELDRRVPSDSYALSGGTYWTGQLPTAIYAIHMKAGARYVLRRDIYSDGMGQGRVSLTAREEPATGPPTDLNPASSEEEVRACR